jgi:hypothetical protein
VAALLLYEHLIVRPDDLRRLDAAFFTVNGVLSIASASSSRSTRCSEPAVEPAVRAARASVGEGARVRGDTSSRTSHFRHDPGTHASRRCR